MAPPSEQNIPLIRIDWTGEVVNVISGYGYAGQCASRRMASRDPIPHGKRMEFSNHSITRKIERCLLTIEKSIRRSEAWEKAMQRAYAALTELELNPPDNEALREIKANAAAAYFRAWREIPLKWQNSARNPIPDDWKFVGSRTSRFGVAGNRNTSQPVNAILNYRSGLKSMGQ
jgi:CRISPR/Cas system-associated endonuclease Cas1